MDVPLDVLVHVFEALRREGRAGGNDGSQRGQVVGLAGAEAGLAQRIQVAGRGAEQGHAGGFGEVEERAVAGWTGEPS